MIQNGFLPTSALFGGAGSHDYDLYFNKIIHDNKIKNWKFIKHSITISDSSVELHDNTLICIF